MEVRSIIRTSNLFLLLFLIINTCSASQPWILSVKVQNVVCDGNCAYNLDVKGDFADWSLTFTPGSSGVQCLPEFVRNKNVVIVPSVENRLFFCAKSAEGVWFHQGERLFLDAGDVTLQNSQRSKIDGRSEKLENFDYNSLENEIEVNDLLDDVAVNQNGENIGDVLIETFSYKPQSSLKLVLPEVKPQEVRIVPEDEERLVLQDEKELALKDGMKIVPENVETLVQQDELVVPVDEERLVPENEQGLAQNEKAVSEGEEKIVLQNAKLVPEDEERLVLIDEKGIMPQNDKEIVPENELKIISQDGLEISQSEAVPYEISIVPEDFTLNKDVLSRSKRQVDETASAEPPNLPENAENSDNPQNTSEVTEPSSNNNSLGQKPKQFTGPIKILGLRVEESAKEPKIVDEMIPSVLTGTKFTMRLFGENLANDTIIAFTHTPGEYGRSCYHLLDEEYPVLYGDKDSALLDMIAPAPEVSHTFYICARDSSSSTFIHQGSEKWKILATHNKLLPLWVSLILIVILLVLASLFSGLNLGLMALDRTELKIIANTGTEKERKYARAIMPVRAHGNYLLCTILLSNVAVNSTFTVILDDLTSGLVAVIGSTLAIVFIAEITPQAICARHGLLVGAKSIWIMKIVMGICAPLAWPTSKLLDYFLGEEIGTHYNRERLKELVRVTDHVNDLDKEEVNIISGALDLRKKKVSDVMTKLKDCFMLPVNSVLDFETMSEIVKSGYSRIPVYEGSRTNIVTVLFIKDLAFVDPDDNTPLRTLCQYYQNPCNFVFEDVTLDVMLKQFKEGHKGHMAFVQRIDEGDGDPVYETVGLVTLEDVIEEMIQAEIVDETDVISDNRTKKRLARPVNKFQDLAAFAGHHEHQRVHVSPQLVLATFQFLNTSVDPFRPEYISENVLRRLLKQDVIQHIKLRGDEDKNDPKRYVFQEGKAVDYFVLILEGRVEVTVGRENLVFEAGPFTYFGVQALTQNVGVAEAPSPSTRGSLQNLNMDSMLGHTFVPDYSVKAIAELYYLAIKRTMYLNAKRATLMEKGALNKGGTNEQIEPEVDKLLREGERIDELGEIDLPKQMLPASASPYTNSTFRAPEKQLRNPKSPEEEKLLKK